MNHIIKSICYIAVILLISSCASKRMIGEKTTNRNRETPPKAIVETRSAQQLFVQKVIRNRLTAQDVVAKASISLTFEDKNISVPGAIKMRRNTVIRLQAFMPFLGCEVGRIEFTPNYVLVVDRIHKEYVKASYKEVDFLQRNALNFYTLQALFWNELFVPGKQQVDDKDVSIYNVTMLQQGNSYPISLKKGSMMYGWNADKRMEHIVSSTVKYTDVAYTTSVLTWFYSDFKNVGLQQYPTKQVLNFSTSKSNSVKSLVQLCIEMEDVKNNNNWDVHTTVSNRYQRKDINNVLRNLFILQ